MIPPSLKSTVRSNKTTESCVVLQCGSDSEVRKAQRTHSARYLSVVFFHSHNFTHEEAL